MILEIEISDEERERLLKDRIAGYSDEFMQAIRQPDERVRVDWRQAHTYINFKLRELSEIRQAAEKKAQDERNRAWEKKYGQKLGEEAYVDEHGNVHDPLGHQLQRARAAYYDR